MFHHVARQVPGNGLRLGLRRRAWISGSIATGSGSGSGSDGVVSAYSSSRSPMISCS
jgi:hypothetical protein